MNESVSRIDQKIKSLESSVNKLNEENDKAKSIFYVDAIQTDISISPGDYPGGPYTISSNFEVLSYLSMTNGNGDRAAFVTVKNNGPATRLLKEYFVATFGDNSREIASKISSQDKVTSGGVYKFIAYFGNSNYPIINVNTR